MYINLLLSPLGCTHFCKHYIPTPPDLYPPSYPRPQSIALLTWYDFKLAIHLAVPGELRHTLPSLLTSSSAHFQKSSPHSRNVLKTNLNIVINLSWYCCYFWCHHTVLFPNNPPFLTFMCLFLLSSLFSALLLSPPKLVSTFLSTFTVSMNFSRLSLY